MHTHARTHVSDSLVVSSRVGRRDERKREGGRSIGNKKGRRDSHRATHTIEGEGTSPSCVRIQLLMCVRGRHGPRRASRTRCVTESQETLFQSWQTEGSAIHRTLYASQIFQGGNFPGVCSFIETGISSNF